MAKKDIFITITNKATAEILYQSEIRDYEVGTKDMLKPMYYPEANRFVDAFNYMLGCFQFDSMPVERDAISFEISFYNPRIPPVQQEFKF